MSASSADRRGAQALFVRLGWIAVRFRLIVAGWIGLVALGTAALPSLAYA